MPSVELKGETFEVSDSIGLMPLMRFAAIAKTGADSNTLAGLAAMYDLLQTCIADDEWARFEAHATKTRADGDDLFDVVVRVLEVLTDRPTGRPSGSSDGPQSTVPNSTGDSSSRVIRTFEDEGRPDLALLVKKRVEGLRSA